VAQFAHVIRSLTSITRAPKQDDRVDDREIDAISRVLGCLIHLPVRLYLDAKPTIARIKANPTSTGPHHLGSAAVSFARPAPTGNIHETRNRIATTKPLGRLQTLSAISELRVL
jgi:hypothetical protein